MAAALEDGVLAEVSLSDGEEGGTGGDRRLTAFAWSGGGGRPSSALTFLAARFQTGAPSQSRRKGSPFRSRDI